MKKNQSSFLWMYFAAIIFLLLLVTACIMTGIAFALFQLGFFSRGGHHPLVPIVALLFVSVIVGTSLSLILAKKIFLPITAFSHASNEVAKGNFSVRLDQLSKIREIREMTQNFNRMTEELSSIETLRNDFIVNVSHEFKTPLAAIEGYAVLIQDEQLTSAERTEYTTMIIEASQQLSTLTGNILHLSKLENEEIIFEKELFRLDEQIRRVILYLEPLWNAKKLEMTIDLPTTVFRGNQRLLMQVWMNIIGNAIKFSSEHGRLLIILKEEPDDVSIHVEDTGCGMTEEMQQRIFDKFYQGDNARQTQGNGLGLTLANRIVTLFSGSIQVTSQLNQGTKFTISLPKL